jgi:hypothetical protein
MSDDRTRDKNQGEGDRESARRYNEHVPEYVERDDPRRAGRDARDAIEGPEGPALEAAERRGKAPAHMTRLEQLRAAAQRLRHAAADMFGELRERLAARRHPARPDGTRP